MVETKIVAQPRSRVDRDTITDTIARDLAQLRQVAQEITTDTAAPDMEKTVTSLGRLSAEAIMRQWEATAAVIEGLGEDAKSLIGKLRDEMVRWDDNLKHLAETAASFREQGKMAQVLIERSSALSDELRATCEALGSKLKE